MAEEEEDAAPPYFLCPISLQIMKDPVTLPNGVTYDRSSIQRWFTRYGHNTCPVTNQTLSDSTLTPNSTLLRLIHAWQAELASSSKLMASTKLPPLDVPAVLQDAVKELIKHPDRRFMTMGKIKTLVQDNADNRQLKVCMEESGITSILASMATAAPRRHHSSDYFPRPVSTIDEATSLLRLTSPSPSTLKKLAELKDGELIRSLSSTMQKGRHGARVDAALLLESIFRVVDDRFKAAPPNDLFDGAVHLLKDQNSGRASTMAALSILLEAVQHGRNRVKAVQSGAVAVLVELLMEEEGTDRKGCEAMLALLSALCGKAEGREAFMAHGAGVAAVAGKMLKVSHTATEKAVKVLLLLCKYCGGGGLVEEMMTVGAVAKLCMVVQVEHSKKTREMVQQILGLHLRAWNKFPCFPGHCLLI